MTPLESVRVVPHRCPSTPGKPVPINGDVIPRDDRHKFKAVSAPMTPQFLEHLTRYPSFPTQAAELIRVIGLKAAAALIHAWGGQEFRVPSARSLGNRAFGRLADIVGDHAAQAMIREWAGVEIFIPNLSIVLRAYQQDRIIDEYDHLTTVGGLSGREAAFDIGVKYGLTGRAIERATKQPHSGIPPGPFNPAPVSAAPPLPHSRQLETH